MKKVKGFLFGLISKGQLIFSAIACLLVIISSITLDVTTAESSIDERYDFTVVIDAGHGGLDVK